MRKHIAVLGVAALLLGLGLLGGPGSAANNNMIFQPILDDASAQDLIKEQIALIQKEMPNTAKAGREGRKAKKRVQVSAAEIAAIAASAKGGKLDAYKDAAAKLAQGAMEAKGAALTKLVEAVASAKNGSKGNQIDWTKIVDDREDIMHPMKLEFKGGDGIPKSLQTNSKLQGKGGNGIEEKIRALAKRKLTDAQMKKESADLALMADKVAALAQLTEAWTPTKDEGKKKKADWKNWAQDMRTNSLDLAKAAKKGDAAAVHTAAQKLNTTCNQCHGVFKPE